MSQDDHMQIVQEEGTRSSRRLWEAIARVQAVHCVLGKDSQGHGYSYLSFDRILAVTRKACLDAGLVIVQPVLHGPDGATLRTIVAHVESGATMESVYHLDLVQLKACNDAQKMGAAISYARRYAFLSALGLAAGNEDSDAAAIGTQEPRHTPWVEKAFTPENLAAARKMLARYCKSDGFGDHVQAKIRDMHTTDGGKTDRMACWHTLCAGLDAWHAEERLPDAFSKCYDSAYEERNGGAK